MTPSGVPKNGAFFFQYNQEEASKGKKLSKRTRTNTAGRKELSERGSKQEMVQTDVQREEGRQGAGKGQIYGKAHQSTRPKSSVHMVKGGNRARQKNRRQKKPKKRRRRKKRGRG